MDLGLTTIVIFIEYILCASSVSSILHILYLIFIATIEVRPMIIIPVLHESEAQRG